MTQKDNRGSLYLVTAFILGVALGLVYGWLIEPLSYSDTKPQMLRVDFKDRYRVLIAKAFLSNHDIGRAVGRLELLGDADSVVALTLQAQRAIAEGSPEADVQALTYLMLALSQSDLPIQLPTSISPLQTPTLSISSTATPTLAPVFTATPLIGSDGYTVTGVVTTTTLSTVKVTRTPSATPGAVFALYEQTLICEPLQDAPVLQIETLDMDSNPISGVAITVQRADSDDEERFFTGLKPEAGLGYADFTMLPDMSYLLWLGEGGQPVEIAPPECESGSGAKKWGIWKLIFIRP